MPKANIPPQEDTTLGPPDPQEMSVLFFDILKCLIQGQPEVNPRHVVNQAKEIARLAVDQVMTYHKEYKPLDNM